MFINLSKLHNFEGSNKLCFVTIVKFFNLINDKNALWKFFYICI